MVKEPNETTQTEKPKEIRTAIDLARAQVKWLQDNLGKEENLKKWILNWKAIPERERFIEQLSKIAKNTALTTPDWGFFDLESHGIFHAHGLTENALTLKQDAWEVCKSGWDDGKGGTPWLRPLLAFINSYLGSFKEALILHGCVPHNNPHPETDEENEHRRAAINPAAFIGGILELKELLEIFLGSFKKLNEPKAKRANNGPGFDGLM